MRANYLKLGIIAIALVVLAASVSAGGSATIRYRDFQLVEVTKAPVFAQQGAQDYIVTGTHDVIGYYDLDEQNNIVYMGMIYDPTKITWKGTDSQLERYRVNMVSRLMDYWLEGTTPDTTWWVYITAGTEMVYLAQSDTGTGISLSVPEIETVVIRDPASGSSQVVGSTTATVEVTTEYNVDSPTNVCNISNFRWTGLVPEEVGGYTIPAANAEGTLFRKESFNLVGGDDGPRIVVATCYDSVGRSSLKKTGMVILDTSEPTAFGLSRFYTTNKQMMEYDDALAIEFTATDYYSDVEECHLFVTGSEASAERGNAECGTYTSMNARDEDADGFTNDGCCWRTSSGSTLLQDFDSLGTEGWATDGMAPGDASAPIVSSDWSYMGSGGSLMLSTSYTTGTEAAEYESPSKWAMAANDITVPAAMQSGGMRFRAHVPTTSAGKIMGLTFTVTDGSTPLIWTFNAPSAGDYTFMLKFDEGTGTYGTLFPGTDASVRLELTMEHCTDNADQATCDDATIYIDEIELLSQSSLELGEMHQVGFVCNSPDLIVGENEVELECRDSTGNEDTIATSLITVNSLGSPGLALPDDDVTNNDWGTDTDGTTCEASTTEGEEACKSYTFEFTVSDLDDIAYCDVEVTRPPSTEIDMPEDDDYDEAYPKYFRRRCELGELGITYGTTLTTTLRDPTTGITLSDETCTAMAPDDNNDAVADFPTDAQGNTIYQYTISFDDLALEESFGEPNIIKIDCYDKLNERSTDRSLVVLDLTNPECNIYGGEHQVYPSIWKTPWNFAKKSGKTVEAWVAINGTDANRIEIEGGLPMNEYSVDAGTTWLSYDDHGTSHKILPSDAGVGWDYDPSTNELTAITVKNMLKFNIWEESLTDGDTDTYGVQAAISCKVTDRAGNTGTASQDFTRISMTDVSCIYYYDLQDGVYSSWSSGDDNTMIAILDPADGAWGVAQGEGSSDADQTGIGTVTDTGDKTMTGYQTLENGLEVAGIYFYINTDGEEDSSPTSVSWEIYSQEAGASPEVYGAFDAPSDHKTTIGTGLMPYPVSQGRIMTGFEMSGGPEMDGCNHITESGDNLGWIVLGAVLIVTAIVVAPFTGGMSLAALPHITAGMASAIVVTTIAAGAASITYGALAAPPEFEVADDKCDVPNSGSTGVRIKTDLAGCPEGWTV